MYPLIAMIVSFLLLMPVVKDVAYNNVQHIGAMKRFIKDAEISSLINLDEIEPKEELYALGAVGELKGEILVIDGEPYIASVKNNKIDIKNDFNTGAALLVYSYVSNWREVEIPDEINEQGAIEDFIRSAATEMGLDEDSAFPFMIEGEINYAKWHVIDWVEGDTVHTHEKHRTSGLQGEIQQEKAKILGFYSENHKGIFTHHTSNMHVHVLSNDEKIAGHIDELRLNGEAVLKLPAFE